MELRSRRAQFIYDRNYNRIGLQSCTKQTSGEEVKKSVTQMEESNGIYMEGYLKKYHFLLFLRIHN